MTTRWRNTCGGLRRYIFSRNKRSLFLKERKSYVNLKSGLDSVEALALDMSGITAILVS